MQYEDPIAKMQIRFEMVLRERLTMSPYQRDRSEPLTKKLLDSVIHGFIIPVVAVERDGSLEVIDGQHRIAAVDKVRPDGWLVPTLICPEKMINLPLLLNIEKADTLKDRCTKIYNFYMDRVEAGDETESKVIEASLFQPYLITLGFAYREYKLSSPSLVESVTKLLDGTLFQPGTQIPMALSEALQVRRNRADAVTKLERIVTEICQENSITDYNLKRAIISRSKEKLWGRKRSVDVSFEEGMASLVMTIMETDWSWMARV